MSRKLTYAAGLLYCFSLADELWNEAPRTDDALRLQKAIEHLWEKTCRVPLDLLAEAFLRVPSLADEGRALFGAYDEFLELLCDTDVRNRLRSLQPDEADASSDYQRVRDLGRAVERALRELFFSETTPYRFLTETYGVF